MYVYLCHHLLHLIHRPVIQYSSAYGVNVSLAVVCILPDDGNCWSSAYLTYNINSTYTHKLLKLILLFTLIP